MPAIADSEARLRGYPAFEGDATILCEVFMTLPDFLTQEPQGYIHFTGHRVGLHHLLRLYNDGYSPEMLLEYFPTLSLAAIHKAIAFYLENQAEVDAYVAGEQAIFEQQVVTTARGPGIDELRRRMQAIRRAKAQ